MSFKSLFIAEEEPTKPQPAVTTPARVVVVDHDTVRATVATAPTQSIESIKRRVIPSNGALNGFMASMESLAQFIPDEGTRAKAALATLASQGVSHQAIASQIETVLGSLKNEEERFEQAKQQRIQSEVTAKLGAADAVKHECEELSTQLGRKEAEESMLRREAVGNQTKIDSAAAEFSSAINVIKTQIESIASRI